MAIAIVDWCDVRANGRVGPAHVLVQVVCPYRNWSEALFIGWSKSPPAHTIRVYAPKSTGSNFPGEPHVLGRLLGGPVTSVHAESSPRRGMDGRTLLPNAAFAVAAICDFDGTGQSGTIVAENGPA